MNNVERISKLENTVRAFRIASSGGVVLGGFGELNNGDTEEEVAYKKCQVKNEQPPDIAFVRKHLFVKKKNPEKDIGNPECDKSSPRISKDKIEVEEKSKE